MELTIFVAACAVVTMVSLVLLASRRNDRRR